MSCAAGTFAWNDPLDLEGRLGDEEKRAREEAQGFAQRFLLPRVVDDYLQDGFDRDVMRQMGQQGLLGCAIPQAYGGAGLNEAPYGRAITGLHAFFRPAGTASAALIPSRPVATKTAPFQYKGAMTQAGKETRRPE